MTLLRLAKAVPARAQGEERRATEGACHLRKCMYVSSRTDCWWKQQVRNVLFETVGRAILVIRWQGAW